MCPKGKDGWRGWWANDLSLRSSCLIRELIVLWHDICIKRVPECLASREDQPTPPPPTHTHTSQVSFSLVCTPILGISYHESGLAFSCVRCNSNLVEWERRWREEQAERDEQRGRCEKRREEMEKRALVERARAETARRHGQRSGQRGVRRSRRYRQISNEIRITLIYHVRNHLKRKDVWQPILRICALHLTHPSAHTQQWVVNTHTNTQTVNTYLEQ